MKKILYISLALFGIVIATGYFLPTLIWDGGTTANISFKISSETDKLPVSGVKVLLLRQGTSGAVAVRESLTNVNGECVIREMFPAGGTFTFFYRTTTISTLGFSARLEKDGYNLLETPLSKEGRVEGRAIHLDLTLIPKKNT